MKKLILLLSFLFCASFSHAQLSKKIILGGDFSYQAEGVVHSNDDELQKEFTLVTSFGKMVSEKVAIGINVSYAREVSIDPFNEQFISKAINVSPYVRYHKELSERFFLIVQSSIGKSFNLSEGSNSEIKYFNFGTNLGLMYFITPKFCIETSIAGLHYNQTKYSDDAKYKYWNFSSSISSPQLGFRFYL